MSDVNQPTVRWAGIIWGTVLALLASTGILLLALPVALDQVFANVRPWLFGLRPEWFGAVVPLVLGVLAVALGVGVAMWRRRREPGPRVSASHDVTEES
ncbi:hypothetical protein [Microbacterium sp. NPDC096154]|uniref:hypothetical protein n=1 Tax=Microbacterium sp. NPDC096154 TaxID=3155549 RepID=UPI003325625B